MTCRLRRLFPQERWPSTRLCLRSKVFLDSADNSYKHIFKIEHRLRTNIAHFTPISSAVFASHTFHEKLFEVHLKNEQLAEEKLRFAETLDAMHQDGKKILEHVQRSRADFHFLKEQYLSRKTSDLEEGSVLKRFAAVIRRMFFKIIGCRISLARLRSRPLIPIEPANHGIEAAFLKAALLHENKEAVTLLSQNRELIFQRNSVECDEPDGADSVPSVRQTR